MSVDRQISQQTRLWAKRQWCLLGPSIAHVAQYANTWIQFCMTIWTFFSEEIRLSTAHVCSGRLGPNIPILPAANTVSYKGLKRDTSHLYRGIQHRAKKSGVKFCPFLVHRNTTLNFLKFPPKESLNDFFRGKFEKMHPWESQFLLTDDLDLCILQQCVTFPQFWFVYVEAA